MAIERGEIRGLTVLQPFADAIMHGPKTVENRHQRLHLPEGGLWVAIHAGLRLWPANEDEIRELWPSCPPFGEMVRGEILGLAHLKEIRKYDPSDRVSGLPGDLWATGPWCWIFGKKMPLANTISYRGKQGLWRLSQDVEAELKEFLRINGLLVD